MTIRQDDRLEYTLNVDVYNDKKQIREYILKQWINEACNTKLRYFVEELSDKRRIYLERPARLNKGCDFVIYVEDLVVYKNGKDKAPSHNIVLDDLSEKKALLPEQEWNLVLFAIESIYLCKSFATSYSIVEKVKNINNGCSYELLLKLIRWFFIEQDITYWSGEGRDKLYNAIKEL